MNKNQIQNQTANNGELELSLWDMARALLSKLHWLIFAGIVAAVAVYIAVSLFVTPTYVSRVSFYVYNSSSTQTGFVNNSDLQAAESLATTYAKILSSNTVLDAVLNDLGSEYDLSRDALNAMTESSVVTNTQLLSVVITSTDPNCACKIAESFARVAPSEVVRITKAGSVEVVDQPEVASSPSTPRTVRDSAMGFIAGVVLAAAIIILRALADTTIYLPEDIENVTAATILGQIPEIVVSEGKHEFWELTNGGVVHYED